MDGTQPALTAEATREPQQAGTKQNGEPVLTAKPSAEEQVRVATTPRCCVWTMAGCPGWVLGRHLMAGCTLCQLRMRRESQKQGLG